MRKPDKPDRLIAGYRRHMILRLCGLALVALCATGCGTVGYFGEYRGVVVDDADGKPLEGVSVSVLYIIECVTPIHASNRVVDGAETFTDEKGEFVIPSKVVSSSPGPCYYRSQPNMKIIKPYYHYLVYPYDSGPPVLDIYGNKHKPPVSGTKLVYRLKVLTEDDYISKRYHASYGLSSSISGLEFIPKQKNILRQEEERAETIYLNSRTLRSRQ